MKRTISSAQAELLRAIGKISALQPATSEPEARGLPGLTVSNVSSAPWAALLFDGELHRIELTLRGTAAGVAAASHAIAVELPQRDFEMRGHFVYQATLLSARMTDNADRSTCELCIEVVTIAD